ncbi:phosphoglycerate mutase family protein [Trichomonas vaginalis G3]|uniref:phosphoglycerate mutase (2,3-diphosphoglycerate-dependent) n=1 Tax=Trichomonas vaginalis (strain ATCC PRA-98 / G3) TaxID=412133 RepID=A2D7L8_TRIV3|nr:histidine phosphatase superfamily (branch 1) family [Trichomonas vaginalis G3]EAY23735.1 phosphoglycerate mutase family protein [Trichomonas vaginalis G3]KAI5490230.1 histidine phosphatase superfamily (branch 1) family [Trichomonas vaginalis G3]|eukprot:XP_001276983.1 phosphoglycerate mutase family protein [Trichomonas vaginalis G3]
MISSVFRNASDVKLGILNMPIDLVLVRHGAAEGNIAFAQSRKGNDELFTDKFMERHESKWRLTPEGKQQSIITGNYIKQNISPIFGAYIVSEYIRAMETAALLNLPNAHWIKNGFLRERNFGDLSGLSYREREERFSRALELRKRDAFYWKPPSGESLADLALRVDYIIGSIQHMSLTPSSVIIVTHFNVMQLFRTRIERIRQSHFEEKLIKVPEELKIKNAGIIHYTRKNPKNGKIADTYHWRRIITPWHRKLCNPPWTEIKYGYLTNEEILNELEDKNKVSIKNE